MAIRHSKQSVEQPVEESDSPGSETNRASNSETGFYLMKEEHGTLNERSLICTSEIPGSTSVKVFLQPMASPLHISTEQSNHWEANSQSAGQEIPRPLRIINIHTIKS
jgi:hypothetical protein